MNECVHLCRLIGFSLFVLIPLSLLLLACLKALNKQAPVVNLETFQKSLNGLIYGKASMLSRFLSLQEGNEGSEGSDISQAWKDRSEGGRRDRGDQVVRQEHVRAYMGHSDKEEECGYDLHRPGAVSGRHFLSAQANDPLIIDQMREDAGFGLSMFRMAWFVGFVRQRKGRRKD